MSKTRGHRKCAKARCSICNQAELNRLKYLKATGGEEAMTNLQHKVVTKAARTATKIGGFVDKTVYRSYRRRIAQQVNHLRTNIKFDSNYNPRRNERWTDWDTI